MIYVLKRFLCEQMQSALVRLQCVDVSTDLCVDQSHNDNKDLLIVKKRKKSEDAAK